MKFIPFEIYTGEKNMAIDAEILENSIQNQEKEPIFRLYGWSPACVSLGRNQKDDFVDYEFLKNKGIDVVRRLTGGRALLHDNEITYSFVCPVDYLKNGGNVTESYKEISQILIDKFEKMGIPLEFGGVRKPMHNVDYCMLIATGADLCYQGKKLIGSAQFRKDGYILQHGSILFDCDRNLLGEIFAEEVDASSITTIREINSELSFEEVVKYLSN